MSLKITTATPAEALKQADKTLLACLRELSKLAGMLEDCESLTDGERAALHAQLATADQLASDGLEYIGCAI